jgi:hypothetical protein
LIDLKKQARILTQQQITSTVSKICAYDCQRHVLPYAHRLSLGGIYPQTLEAEARFINDLTLGYDGLYKGSRHGNEIHKYQGDWYNPA